MYRYNISVFFKETPTNPTAADLLNAATLRAGDRYTRVFKEVVAFSIGSDANVLQELFASFNGQGNPLPEHVTIPRSMSIGDIITGEGALAFLVTETGFERLAFAPRAEKFEITDALLSRKIPDGVERIVHPLTPTEA